MLVALHRLERRQHRERVVEAFAGGVEPDVTRHLARQPRQVERQELVQVDGGNEAVVERFQHLGRDQRDAVRTLA